MKKVTMILLTIISMTLLIDVIRSKPKSIEKFAEKKGMQIYLPYSKDYYAYATLEKSDCGGFMNGKIHLYTKTSEIPKEGYYVSLGLGSDGGMDGSDMVVCQYFGYPERASCKDYYSKGHTPILDTELGGTDDVTMVSYHTSFLDNKWEKYSHMIRWEFTKSLTSNDKFDWKDIMEFDTNKGTCIGALGNNNLDNDGLLYHIDYSAGILVDGNGVPDHEEL